MKKKTVGEWLHDNLVWIALIPVIVTMVTIFAFSSQTAETSGEESNRITKIVIKILVRDYDELPRAEQKRIRNNVSHAVRKTAHVIEYTVLGFFSMMYTEIINLKKRFKPGVLKYLLAFVFSFAYAASDEYHQRFVSGRGGMFSDVLIDGLGAIIGIILLEILITVLINKKLKQRKAASETAGK